MQDAEMSLIYFVYINGQVKQAALTATGVRAVQQEMLWTEAEGHKRQMTAHLAWVTQARDKNESANMQLCHWLRGEKVT